MPIKVLKNRKVILLTLFFAVIIISGFNFFFRENEKKICVEIKTEGWLGEKTGEACNESFKGIRCISNLECGKPEKQISCGTVGKSEKTLREIKNNKCKCYVHSGKFPAWQCEKNTIF